MNEDQRVVDFLQNYAPDDPFWEPYSIDPAFSFEIISTWSDLSIAKMEIGSMKFNLSLHL